MAIHRRGAGDIWQGLWEPYTSPSLPEGEELVLIKKGVRHVLTHRILYADFYLWEPEEKPSLPSDYIWIKETELDQYAVPRLIEILLESLKPAWTILFSYFLLFLTLLILFDLFLLFFLILLLLLLIFNCDLFFLIFLLIILFSLLFLFFLFSRTISQRIVPPSFF